MNNEDKKLKKFEVVGSATYAISVVIKAHTANEAIQKFNDLDWDYEEELEEIIEYNWDDVNELADE